MYAWYCTYLLAKREKKFATSNIYFIYTKYNFNYNFNELLTDNEFLVRSLLDTRMEQCHKRLPYICAAGINKPSESKQSDKNYVQ